MQNNKTTTDTGITFAGGLTLLFIALKLTGVINWNWFFVCLPTILPIVIILCILCVIGILIVGNLIIGLVTSVWKRIFKK